MGMNAMMANTGPAIKRIITVLVEDTNQDRIHPEYTRRDLRASTLMTASRKVVALAGL